MILALLARTNRGRVYGRIASQPFLGYSTEFSSYRSYTQGDDLRYVDWKVWGRSDKYYVKQFEDDTNLTCQIFLDTSGSMDFGKADANKFDYGRILAAVLAYLMNTQHDAPGLICSATLRSRRCRCSPRAIMLMRYSRHWRVFAAWAAQSSARIYSPSWKH
jgi:uncharacterized protein (DUF58 family)